MVSYTNLLNYYSTPGEIYNLLKFSEEKKIDLKEINLKDFLLKQEVDGRGAIIERKMSILKPEAIPFHSI